LEVWVLSCSSAPHKKNGKLSDLNRLKPQVGIVPRVRLGKFAVDIYPAYKGRGFDLVLVFRGHYKVVENVTCEQVHQLLHELEIFSK
jgi:hypothetical protein